MSLWPGLVLTEGLLSQAVVNADGTTQLHGLDLAFGEMPTFNGKAVVALASDRQILERTGGSYWSSRLAREYGFAEDDGSLPPELVDGMTTPSWIPMTSRRSGGASTALPAPTATEVPSA